MLLFISNNTKDLVEEAHCLDVVRSLKNNFNKSFLKHSVMG